MTVARIMDVLVGIRQAGELLSQEDALLTGAVTAGRLDREEFAQLVEIFGAIRFQIPNAGSALPEDVRASYDALLANPPFVQLRAAHDITVSARAKRFAAVESAVSRGLVDAARSVQAADRFAHALGVLPG